MGEVMSTKAEANRACEFIISESGISRDVGRVATGQELEAGRVLQRDGDGNLIAFTGTGTAAAGILLYPVDTTDGVVSVGYLARKARVNFEDIIGPPGKAATTAAALAALGIKIVSPPLSDEGGGGGAYVAKAVHTTDTAALGLNVPMPFSGKTNNGKAFGVVWLANDAISSSPRIEGTIDVIAAGTYPTEVFALFQTNTIDGMGITSSPISLNDYFLDVGTGTDLAYDTDDTNIFPLGSTWTCFAYSHDSNHADPSKRFQIARNGVVLSLTPRVSGDGDITVPLTVDFNSETNFYALTDGFGTGVTIDASDWQFFQGIAPDLSDAAVMDKIIRGGKPVDPSELATFLGVQPDMLFQVTGSDPDEFRTNKGTAGAASSAGTLTNAGTSPSD
jgi:hypothetical protein